MKKLILTIVLVGLLAVPALGNLTNPNRPWGDASSLSELQGVLTSIGSSIDAVSDQSGAAIFTPTSSTASSTYIATVSWYYPDIEFGIYDLDDTTNRLEMFSFSTVSVGDTAIMQFNEGADTVTIYDSTMTLLAQTTYFKNFGFYAVGEDHDNDPIGPYYSEDDLNPYSDAHFLTYEAKGDDVTIGTLGTYNDVAHWYVAAETDIPINRTADADFSDFIVQVESITPTIPAPGAILLGSIGVALVGWLRRRKTL